LLLYVQNFLVFFSYKYDFILWYIDKLTQRSSKKLFINFWLNFLTLFT
jgi:hypothetical protein